jgi:hypothetical protein
MARVRNAFKIRAADAPIIETSQFLQLYCPLLLDQLEHDDLFVPKLIIVRGSPGSGKSSLLRLFETDTLLAIHARRSQRSDQELVERLTELGVLAESGPRVFGLYIQCDSSLRDTANLPATQSSLRLFNTLLDTRILVLFLRAVRRLIETHCLMLPADFTLEPLPSSETPPHFLSQRCSLDELEEKCSKIESDFGLLLNSFPDDPLPPSIQPHARVYSLSYMSLQLQRNPSFSDLVPIVMLDDVQELYPEQRQQLKDEFMRRVSIPRWLAARTHVFGLEELISVEGAEEGREYREIPLDEIFQERPSVFTKFATNVAHRRLQHTDSLQQVSVADFKDLLLSPPDVISPTTAQKAIEGMIDRVSKIRQDSAFQTKLETITSTITTGGDMAFDDVLALERELIGFERQANREQGELFPNEIPEVVNGKTTEAARLFLTRRLRVPHYCGFDTLTNVASGNVEQLLSTCASVVDRMIYRAELDRDKAISAKEQEENLKRSADAYYDALENKHRRGSAVKQFVDNLGRFFEDVTYRPNAPIAPGVNGFGLTRRDLDQLAGAETPNRETQIFREVLTNAVAGNIFSVRLTKQGQAGSEKIVFYLNRILCVRFRLPLNYGGWQRLPVPLLMRMIKEPVPLKDMTRRSGAMSDSLWNEGHDK